MIRNAVKGESVITPDGRIATVTEVYRIGNRANVKADNEWYMAWQLKRAAETKREAKQPRPLTAVQQRICDMIKAEPTISQAEIARRLNTSRQAVHIQIKKINKKLRLAAVDGMRIATT